jgi:hypothetical protein
VDCIIVKVDIRRIIEKESMKGKFDDWVLREDKRSVSDRL